MTDCDFESENCGSSTFHAVGSLPDRRFQLDIAAIIISSI
jgi:hypothetical protein